MRGGLLEEGSVVLRVGRGGYLVETLSFPGKLSEKGSSWWGFVVVGLEATDKARPVLQGKGSLVEGGCSTLRGKCPAVGKAKKGWISTRGREDWFSSQDHLDETGVWEWTMYT